LKILSSEKELLEYSKDAGIYEFRPKAVLIADDKFDLLEVMRRAHHEGVALTPRGSGTSIPTQSVGRGFVVLQSPHEVQVLGEEFECSPAVVKADLNSLLEAKNLWMPVDPSSYRACSIGGMVSNNSSGPRTMKYGSTIDYVNELTVVLPEEGIRIISPVPLQTALHGEPTIRKVASLVVENWKKIVREKPRTTKNSSGYRLERLIHDDIFDLPKLFVGSEGTLGLISRIRCRTIRRPLFRRMMILSIDTLKELDVAVEELRRLKPSAIEIVDKSIFVRAKKESMLYQLGDSRIGYLVYAEIESDAEKELDEKCEDVASNKRLNQYDPMLLTSPEQMSRAWETRNQTLTIAGEIRSGRRSPVPGVEDLVVPRDKLGAILGFLESTFSGLGLEFISYGHAGDANLHVRPLLDLAEGKDKRLLDDIMTRCFDEVWRMGGSITGEHGDGLLRAAYVKEQYPETYEIMTEIKRIYDPRCLMNPGVKFQLLS